jgi:hypothetical protein
MNYPAEYDCLLSDLRKLADAAGLGIKTYCLVYLGCETVPEAIQKLAANQKTL